jgi:alkyl hydroperoxide reductase subunit AhpF
MWKGDARARRLGGAPPAPMPVADGPLPADEVDVAVIGGGINGTGVARDFALRVFVTR